MVCSLGGPEPSQLGTICHAVLNARAVPSRQKYKPFCPCRRGHHQGTCQMGSTVQFTRSCGFTVAKCNAVYTRHCGRKSTRLGRRFVQFAMPSLPASPEHSSNWCQHVGLCNLNLDWHAHCLLRPENTSVPAEVRLDHGRARIANSARVV